MTAQCYECLLYLRIQAICNLPPIILHLAAEINSPIHLFIQFLSAYFYSGSRGGGNSTQPGFTKETPQKEPNKHRQTLTNYRLLQSFQTELAFFRTVGIKQRARKKDTMITTNSTQRDCSQLVGYKCSLVFFISLLLTIPILLNFH